MTKSTLFTLAAIVAVPLIANGQTDKTPPSQKAPAAGQTKTADMPHVLKVQNAERLIGMDVENLQGEKLGQIEDMVFYPNGKVAYVVMSTGGVLGVGDKLHAVPYGLIADQARSAAIADRDDQDEIILSIDKERLKAAPGFDKSNWPSSANTTVFDDVDRFYERERSALGRPVEASARTAGMLIFRASELDGKNVENPQGEKLGDIKHVVIDPSNGRIVYVALSVGGFLGMGDRVVAVPWEAIKTMRTDDDKEKLVLDASKDHLKAAPEYMASEARWREMSDPVYVEKVYVYYKVSPYWHTTGAESRPERNTGETKKN